jgi:hypothetical protein
MNVLILKLSCGTELLCSVAEHPEKPGAYFCSEILQLITDVSPEGGGRMGMVDFMPYSDAAAGFVVPSNMTALAFPSPELMEHYNKRFSKIIMPESKIQLA